MLDHAAVADLILGRPMCERCLASVTGLGAANLRGALIAIRTTFRLHDAPGQCPECREPSRVLSLDRPAGD